MSTTATFLLPALSTASLSARSAASDPVSDVRLFHTADGGDIEFVGGLITMADGLETAAYLSLFGGNERDSGLAADDRLQWWGNLLETEEARTYRSQTQNLLRALPATTAHLRRIEDAVSRDLSWMTAELASKVGVSATMPRLNTVQIDIAVELKSGTKYTFQFTTAWGARA